MTRENRVPSDSSEWGFFRFPALLGPAVGFIAFLVSGAIKSPGTGTGDALIWFPLLLIVAVIFAAIPTLLGAVLLLTMCRILPNRLVRFTALRLILGALVGAVIAWPFTHALNWIPSANADPRFNPDSMLVGCAVAGVYCAAFLSLPSSAENRPHQRE